MTRPSRNMANAELWRRYFIFQALTTVSALGFAGTAAGLILLSKSPIIAVMWGVPVVGFFVLGMFLFRSRRRVWRLIQESSDEQPARR